MGDDCCVGVFIDCCGLILGGEVVGVVVVVNCGYQLWECVEGCVCIGGGFVCGEVSCLSELCEFGYGVYYM